MEVILNKLSTSKLIDVIDLDYGTIVQYGNDLCMVIYHSSNLKQLVSLQHPDRTWSNIQVNQNAVLGIPNRIIVDM